MKNIKKKPKTKKITLKKLKIKKVLLKTAKKIIKPKKKAVVKKPTKQVLKVKKNLKKVKKAVKKSTTKSRVKVGKISKNKNELERQVKLKKTSYNPIISPSLYPWENVATFNPAAVESNGKIHLLYRAIGEGDTSVLGYASTFDGVRISERPTYAAYRRGKEKIDFNNNYIGYVSGGGWSGGCEDPRLSLIDNTLYMLYTAFDGWGSVRIALTSIDFNDFKKKRWNWKKSVLISPPGELSKNWLLFPEKINGKYAILHGISDGILVDYFDNLNKLDGKYFIKSISHEARENAIRKTGIRSAGPTPIKTSLGWLVLYHISEGGKYKVKAMILDEKDPTKVLYRSKNPILEPTEDYENHGIAYGVVYSCGAVVKKTGNKEELFVYYGGADKYVCVASIPLQELLDDLKQDKEIKLSKKGRMNSQK